MVRLFGIKGLIIIPELGLEIQILLFFYLKFEFEECLFFSLLNFKLKL